jgi:hypothetical protein
VTAHGARPDDRCPHVLAYDDDRASARSTPAPRDEGYRVTLAAEPLADVARSPARARLVVARPLAGREDVGSGFLARLKATPPPGPPGARVQRRLAACSRAAAYLDEWACAVVEKPFDIDAFCAAVRGLPRAGADPGRPPPTDRVASAGQGCARSPADVLEVERLAEQADARHVHGRHADAHRMTGTAMPRERNSRTKATPSIRGIITSLRTRSGASASTRRAPPRPSRAPPPGSPASVRYSTRIAAQDPFVVDDEDQGRARGVLA